MPREGRNRKNPRQHGDPLYYDAICEKCGRNLTMKRGRKPKCPSCDGNGSREEQRARKFGRRKKPAQFGDASTPVTEAVSSVENKTENVS